VLVTVKGFGGIWERRFANATARSRRFAQAAFYDTTGVLVSGKVRYRWKIGGKLRFNAVGGFTPSDPSRSLNRVFECKDPETTGAGWTQNSVQTNADWSGAAGLLPVRRDSRVHRTTRHWVVLLEGRSGSGCLRQ
jgi:hypothetical protein